MPTGRIQVANGQTIESSEWGNIVWDQSVQTFASAADRDNQWPAPHAGAICWVDDLKVLTGYTGTGWILLGPTITGFAGPAAFKGAAYNPNKPIHRLTWGNLTGTSDVSGYIYLPHTVAGVTSILSIIAAWIGSSQVMPRSGESSFTQLVLQTRSITTGAAAGSLGYNCMVEMVYQI